MNYRLATLFSRKTYSADATEVIDVDIVDPISQLIVELAVTNTGSGSATAHAIKCLNKLELVDGSDVLFSLNGYEAEAVDYYHNGKMRSNRNPYLNGMDVQRFIGINFGRFLHDPLLALDPKHFSNLQLKITLDIDAGGVSANANKVQVLANLFDEKAVSPIGFLMHKEIKDYQMAASAWEDIDMPKDHPYRKLFIRCQTAGTEGCQLLDKIKLTENIDKKVVLEEDPSDLMRSIAHRLPPIVEGIYLGVGTAITNGFCTPSERVTGTVNTWDTTTGAGEIAFYDGDGGRFRIISATATKNVNVNVLGWSPHNTWEIPCGDQDDPDDWYDVTKLGDLKLKLLALSGASSANTVQVFLQQLRKY